MCPYQSTRVKGDFDLTGATLGKGEYSFEGCDFEQRGFFARLQGVEQVESFSFRYVSFEKPLILSTDNNKPFDCVVDLTDTQINSHVSLQGLNIQPKETTEDDIGRFCRLKELAEGNKDHERALEFKAQEILATRQHQNKGLAKVLPWCFEKLSDYGRSECCVLCADWEGFVYFSGYFIVVYRLGVPKAQWHFM